MRPSSHRSRQVVDVVRQMADAAVLFGNVLARLGDDEWRRMVVCNRPFQAARSLRWVVVHTLQEAIHHLVDIRRQADPVPHRAVGVDPHDAGAAAPGASLRR